MITTESLQNLNGDVIIPTEQIIYMKNNKLLTGGGTEIVLSNGSISGGGGSSGGSGTPTEVQDLSLEFTNTALAGLTNGIIEIDQEIDQGNFNRFETIITQKDFNLAPTMSDHFDVLKIQMKVRTAGYQMVKILLFDQYGKVINFNRVDSDTVQATSNTNIKIDVTSSGFMLVTNATYELANVFNTDTLPVAGVGGWYSLTSSTDANSNFTAMFTAPVSISKIRVYRCGAASTTFNGGTDAYDLILTDASNNTTTISVPKVGNDVFLTLDGATEQAVGVTGVAPTPDSKIKRFEFRVSTDGTNFTDISQEGTTSYIANPLTGMYTSKETFPSKNINSRKLFAKINVAEIDSIQSIKFNMWRMETI